MDTVDLGSDCVAGCERLSEPTASQAERFDSSYTLRIPRIGVNAEVVPIHSNQQRILESPSNPSVAGWWSDGAAPARRTDQRYWSGTPYATKAVGFSTICGS
jgi:hypothetical protein